MTGYPWTNGDQLFAADLNAAIALSAPPVGTHYLPTSGAIPMTGPLTLAGNAALPLHAVPLQQVSASLASYAPLASPALTGIPTVPTATTGANTTQVASTAFVASAIAAGGTVIGPLMVTATGGTTSRSVQDQLGDLADVKDFGAKGDGTTNDTAAFVAAAATGKTVLVTPGTYIIGPITISQSMIGMGMGVSILRAAAGGNPANDVLITQNAAVGATIRDLTINGANLCLYGIGLGSAPQQTGLRFAGLEVCNIGNTSSGASPLPGGIFWYASTVASKQGIVVTECYIHDVYGDGIHADGTGNIISHNTIINIGSAGIAYDLMVDGVISGNTINNIGTLPVIAADGITGYGQNNLRMLLIGNTIDTGQNNGIHIGGNNNQIVGNKVYNVQAYGILLQAAPNASPTPCVNGLIANNEVDTAAGGGIRCGYFSRVTVSGNTVSNLPSTAGPGILFLISSDSVCTGNVVYNIGNDGIAGNTALNLIVNGNRISTVTGMGIHDLGSSTGMRVSENIITGEGTVSNWDRVLAPLGSGITKWYNGATQVAYLDGGGNFYTAGNVWSPGGVTVTASGTYPFQLVLASGNQQLQFQGPNYAISCSPAGSISFLVGSPVMTVTPTGASVTGTLAVSGAATAATPVTTDNSTNVATTAFVKAQGYAPLASPTFTGTVAIPGGTINNTAIGGTTAAAGAFTTLSASGAASFTNNVTTVAAGTAQVGGGGGGRGAQLGGSGTTYDVCLQNKSGAIAAAVPTGTANLTVVGTVTAATLALTANGTNWTAGSGAPASTQPVGSLYTNYSGAVGARLYVSAGGGAWNAVAGV